ncbi:MAG: TatD family hydrolase, partial [Fusobacteriaceae bacterium]
KNAAEMNLPIVLHIVGKDIYKVLGLLDKYKIKKAMFHWYIGTEKEIAEIVKRGYFISVNIDCKENYEYRKYVNKIPLDNMFIETDAPYGYTRATSVTQIIGMYEEISKLLNLSVNFVQEKIENNCSRFFIKISGENP